MRTVVRTALLRATLTYAITALLCATLAYAIHTVKTGITPPPPVMQADPVITVETKYGIATITGPAAEYVLESAFPVVLDQPE